MSFTPCYLYICDTEREQKANSNEIISRNFLNFVPINLLEILIF